MDGAIDTSKETPGTGLPAQAETEKRPDTTTSVEEANRQALGNSGDDAASIPTGVSLVESITLTRATMALRIEPWRLLPQELRDAHAARECGGRDKCIACDLSSALFDAQRSCAVAANLIARHCERLDGEFWDKALLKAEGGNVRLPKKKRRMPDGKERESVVWPSDGWNAYEAARQACPQTLSGIIASISNQVVTKWRQDRFSIFAKMERSAARYKRETMPIPLRAADCKLIETDTRDLFELHCTLRSGRRAVRGKEFAIPVRAKDARQYKTLHEIANGNARMGEIEIKRDRIGRHWEMRVAYKRRVELKQGDKLGAINRGISCVLALVTEDGESYIYDGHDIEAYLAQMEARRRRIQNSYKLSGRKGRGRAHALEPIEVLQGKARRWRHTRMQTIAREAAKWFADRGVTKVLIDDLQGIRDGAVEKLDGGKPVWDRIQTWPFFEQGQRLKSCLQEAGIKFEDRGVKFASRECPSCGNVNEERSIGRTFTCTNCGYRRHVDVVLGVNLINRERSGRSEAAGEVKKKNGKKKRKAQRK